MTNSELGNFFRKSSLGKATFKTNKTATPYELPDIKNTETGNPIFGEIAFFLCETSGEEFKNKGYVDLDKAWTSTDYDALLEGAIQSNIFEDDIIQEMEDDAEWIKDMRNKLLADYPKPFCGRRVYAFAVKRVDEKKKNTAGAEFIHTTWDGLKQVQSKYKKKANEVRYFMKSKVCVFHNEELGYNPEFDKKGGSTTNDKGDVVENKNSLDFVYCGIFMDDVMATRLGQYLRYRLDDAAEKKEIFEGTSVFFLTSWVKTQKEKPNATKKFEGPSYSVDVDDIVYLEGYVPLSEDEEEEE